MTAKVPSLLDQAQARIDSAIKKPLGAPEPSMVSVTLVRGTEVKERPIHWLWPGWIAQGKLTILAGAGGTGKTTLALGLAATITTGGRWPDGATCSKPENVLVWSAEDDIADTLKPRLMACGADVSRVYFVQALIDEEGNSLPFDPARDVPTLHDAVKRIGGASLLVVDPIVSAVAGDMHRANEVRRGLQGLVDLAEECNCAVLGISHFSKGSVGTSPSERVIGSVAFAALARTVLVAAKQEGSESRVLARAKSNISLDDGGVSYSIQPCMIDGGIQTTRVLWGDRIEGTARDILDAVEAHDADERSELDDAADFLRGLLADGPVAAKQVYAEADQAGYRRATIRRAQKALGIAAVKEGGRFGEKEQRWVWKLPRSPEDAQETQKMLKKKHEHLLGSVNIFRENPEDQPPLQEGHL